MRILEWSDSQTQRVEWWVPWPRVRSNRELRLTGYRISVWKPEKVAEIEAVLSVQQCGCA